MLSFLSCPRGDEAVASLRILGAFMAKTSFKLVWFEAYTHNSSVFNKCAMDTGTLWMVHRCTMGLKGSYLLVGQLGNVSTLLAAWCALR